MAKADRSKI